MKTLSPIVLFVYNRPWHTRQTVEALKENELAEQSELFIYSDEAKNEEVQQDVDKVREYIYKIDGFKKVTIIKRERNWGLANSIINGVTNIVNKYGKIIVLEDDLVTSPYFLKYMNEGLTFYKNEKKIWHLSGWNYPIESDGLDDIFCWRLMNCWGWATWDDRWQFYEKNVDRFTNQFSKNDIKRFNLDGAADSFVQVIENKKNKINTWAIFWYITIFNHDGLCINPTQTFIENIGNDGSGEHCGTSERFSSTISYIKNVNFILTTEENKIALERIKSFYQNKKKPFIDKCINLLSKKFKKCLP